MFEDNFYFLLCLSDLWWTGIGSVWYTKNILKLTIILPVNVIQIILYGDQDLSYETHTYVFDSKAVLPVKIRVRIDPPHPLVCLKRRLNGRSFGWDRKNRDPCHSRCGTMKIPPCSKALSAEHRPNTGNGDVSILVKNSWAGRKTVTKQFILELHEAIERRRIYQIDNKLFVFMFIYTSYHFQ
jgi:hypothetical protein